MKITHSWLKDFVDIKISPQALADKLAMAGLEVNSLEEKDGDAVFEIEVTSNRPDWLSAVGIAREIAAITGKRLAGKRVSGLASSIGKPVNRQTRLPVYPLTITIENKKDCPLYTAKIIRDVKVGPSPDWLKKRLELIGCRSINNIVDITNYILFTWGEPLHAFDLDKLVSGLAGKRVSGLEIGVRKAINGEEIVTIDGIKRILDKDILIIASGFNPRTRLPLHPQTSKPIAIAGIIGGKDTEVTDSTKNILLEAAAFDPILVRRGRQKLGIQTDSSYRFERGVNLEGVDFSSLQAAGLIQKLSGGECVLAKSSKSPPKTKKKSLKLSLPAVQKVLGINIPGTRVKTILQSLGFNVRMEGKNNFNVNIPNFRQDISSEIDLIEEVARIFGFGNIPSLLADTLPQITAYTPRDLVAVIKNTLVGLGLNEVITYSLVDKESLREFRNGEWSDTVEILNPLSKQQAVLRNTLIPSLIRCLVSNLNRKQEHVAVFEVAKRFSPDPSGTKEELFLGIALCGARSLFLEEQVVKDKVGLLHLKGVVERVFERLGIESYDFKIESPYTASVNIKGKKIGSLVMLSREMREGLDIKGKEAVVGEFSLEEMFSCACLQKKFSPPSAYPGVVRDISFILKEDVSVAQVLGAVKESGSPLLKEARIIDYYKGKQIPPDSRGLTLACLYRLDERTLTEEEVNPVHALILCLLQERFGAKTR